MFPEYLPNVNKSINHVLIILFILTNVKLKLYHPSVILKILKSRKS